MNRRQFLNKSFKWIILSTILLISMCGKNPVSSNTGSISGKVLGIDQTVKVRAIQNLSLVAETTTNPDGSYKIENLPEGIYGLVFIKLFIDKNGIAYIYNIK